MRWHVAAKSRIIMQNESALQCKRCSEAPWSKTSCQVHKAGRQSGAANDTICPSAIKLTQEIVDARNGHIMSSLNIPQLINQVGWLGVSGLFLKWTTLPLVDQEFVT